ncbi:MAG: diiron oxygenase [Alphaproteobacteria bacterium]|nr:diiron oxygenase [Alphaproteobacteria bacterium]
MADFDAYAKSYLRQWDRRATVRSRQRYQLKAEDLEDGLFPPTLQPAAQHPEIIARGSETVRELLMRSAYHWQSAVADLEVDVVSELCGRLAHGNPRFALPRSARQVALTIGADEMYHSYVASEFNERLQELAGVAFTNSNPSPLLKALQLVRTGAPADLVHEAEIMVLCFAEHLVTEELFGMSSEGAPRGAFQVITREHLMDEGRHQQFFARLAAHMWAELDPAARATLGRLLPGFLNAFLRDDDHFTANATDLVVALGFGPEDAGRIVKEAFDAQYGGTPRPNWELRYVRHCLDLVRSSGMLADSGTREALVTTGWIAP